MPFTDPFVANPFPFSIAATLPAANTLYDVTSSLVSGVYTISWSGGGTLNLDFYNSAGTLVTSASGTSPITVNLAQSVAVIKMWCTTAPISVVISLSGLAVAPISGTLYTYTTSQTITLTGDAYFVLVGAGGGSGLGTGGSGAIVTGRVNLTGALPLVVGIAGTPGVGATPATDGTSSTFAGNTAPGGKASLAGAAGLGGSPNGANGQSQGVGGNGFATSTAAAISGFPFLTMGSTGTGGVNTGLGQGSGIGTGGNGSSTTGVPGGNATGYGASGGSTPLTTASGGLSTNGVLYLVV